MTTESNENDPRVSEVYRDLASETTPPEIDQKILSMAAGEQRSRYGKARAWIRPVAWAATIGLSLAFVLELSQVPDKAPLSTGGSDGDTFEILDEPEVADGAPARAKSDAQLRQESGHRSDSPAATVLATPPAAAESTMDEDSVSAEFEVDDMSLLREAEERARMQSGSTRPAAPVAEVSALVEKKEQLTACDSEARSSAESWYACIEELRASGHSDRAEAELEALLTGYPDFEEPTPNR